MRNKVILNLMVGFILIMPFVFAAENISGGDDAIQKAYNCLSDKVGGREDLSLQEAIFTTLALGYKPNVIKAIENEKKSSDIGDCWPKDNCKIKETAQVALAYDRIGRDTDKIRNWIISKNATSLDLSWYLEIDSSSHVSMPCTITYDGQERNINIGGDMKLSGNPGSCLEIAAGGYWIKIKGNCLNREYKISCDSDFISTLIYQKGNEGIIYVSSKTNSAPSLGTTTEQVSAQCFKTIGGCDYEGSLWAVLALNKLGTEVREFLPYLLALAEENERYFPSTFLYALTSGNDQFGKIINSQKQGKYWQQISTPYNRYYDSSLAMLTLNDNAPAEFTTAQEYFLNIQTESGCWNNDNIRDSAFVLYSGWEKNVPSNAETSTSGGGKLLCGLPNSCELASACEEAGGNALKGYVCSSILQVCCSEKVEEKSCDELNGLKCSANQKCSGEIVRSSDGSCCMGKACQDISQETCERSAGGICRYNCDEGEEKVNEECEDSSESCCVKSSPEPETNWWLWIIILLILIVLAVLGIVYKTKLQLWWHRRKSGNSGGLNQRGPNLPPGFGGNVSRGIPFRNLVAGGRQGPALGRMPMRPVGGDRAMDETMKKLKAMSE